MERYKEIINQVCTNDAVIVSVEVLITLCKWLAFARTEAIESGAIVRRWWDARGIDYAYAACAVIAWAGLMIACAICYAVYAVRWVAGTQWISYEGFETEQIKRDLADNLAKSQSLIEFPWLRNYA